MVIELESSVPPRLNAPSTDRSLVLASGSTRRLALLRQLGLEPLVRVTTIDEAPEFGEQPAALVQRLACAKALAITMAPREVVIAADTIVNHRGRLLGKPRDRDDFLDTFLRLAGDEHEVLSGVAVRTGKAVATVVVSTRVRFAPIDRLQALAYWASGEPGDKAGGYAIQGRGARFVEGLSGSYSNVVGLPLFESVRLLVDAGIAFD